VFGVRDFARPNTFIFTNQMPATVWNRVSCALVFSTNTLGLKYKN
jgi:hypothetical protein